LIPYSGGGALFSSLKIKSMNKFKIRVMASDHGRAGYPEIEKGLKGRVRRQVKGNPKFESWAKDKLGFVPPNGILVGESPGGIPHPQGLRYMELGSKMAAVKANTILTEELTKLN